MKTTASIRLGLVAVGTLLGLAAPASRALSAQAVCSAPHSSPTLTGGGSVGTLPRWGGWVQVSGLAQRATRFYGLSGDPRPFLAGAAFDTRSLFVTGAVGLGRGIEVWAQLPVHQLSIEGSAGTTRSAGIGDVRFAARVGAESVGLDLPVALRAGGKTPGSDFPVDARVLPLTEGQRDWELSFEAGTTLGETGSYLLGWAGHRWREENVAADRDPGDEWFGHLAVGGSVASLGWQVAVDALWGGPLEVLGFRLEDEARRLVQLLPTVGLPVGPGMLEVSAQLPLSGRNLPVSRGVSVGYRFAWGLDTANPGLLEEWLEPR